MKEIDLIIRNSIIMLIINIMLSELHKLFKLIWQKKCCDNKSWKYFFTVWGGRMAFYEGYWSL